MNYPHTTKDSKGNLIHYKKSDGCEYWREFDKNNNIIHYKVSDGYESWKEFDKNNNKIHYKNSNGYETWYDSKGNEIPNPNQTKEISMDEIAQLLKIDVKNLKIKK